eukprot:2493803-Pyramimonas_sp.AAC.1
MLPLSTPPPLLRCGARCGTALSSPPAPAQPAPSRLPAPADFARCAGARAVAVPGPSRAAASGA